MTWSQKYKDSIDCKHPKGFSQRAHCQGRKKQKTTARAVYILQPKQTEKSTKMKPKN